MVIYLRLGSSPIDSRKQRLHLTKILFSGMLTHNLTTAMFSYYLGICRKPLPGCVLIKMFSMMVLELLGSPEGLI